MRVVWRVLGGFLALVLVAAIGVYWWQRPLLLTGTGYAAHNACAVTLIAGRDHPETDLPSNPLVPVLRTSISQDGASSAVLDLLARQRAWFTPGYGCTVAGQAPALPAPTPVDAAANPYASAPEPTPGAAVAAVLDYAFGADLDPAGRAALGTRGVVVLKDGALVGERYADGFSATTPQLGWSMTKSLTNLLVGRLVARGEVSLDDDHLRPEWTDERASVTVRDLLTMTSGLSWDETYDLGTPITRMLYLEPDMGGYVASLPLAHQPGSYQQYSTGSINLLCSVLAPGRGGADWPRQELLGPLGLASMVLEPDGVGTPVCGSYAWATPRDWATVGQFALADGVWNGNRLLPEGWMAESVKAVDVQTEDPGYASGWWANQAADGSLVHPDLPADAYWASGHDGQWVLVVPSEKLVVARLGFTPEADDRFDQVNARLIAALR
ncbi:MAG: serine hydrolase [Propionicimonas sp.]|uniref:serine hydrolase domain-containing protein n=1 Tax=Propionicimonas sp. TaxID=1955623 RepID=UPI002B20A7AC|nr:serine hydrolase [Propionicimonas sp.]MEA4945253.1 serine hydrolase [Propionicimonas sp.]